MGNVLTAEEVETAEQVRETYDVLMKSAPERIVVGLISGETKIDSAERIAFMEAAMLAATKIVIGK